VTVEPGETLWGYAEQLAPQEMGEQEYVAQVRTLNHLPTGRITAGQQIDLLVLDAAAEAVIQQRWRTAHPVPCPDALPVLPPSRFPGRGLAHVRRRSDDPAPTAVPELLTALLHGGD